MSGTLTPMILRLVWLILTLHWRIDALKLPPNEYYYCKDWNLKKQSYDQVKHIIEQHIQNETYIFTHLADLPVERERKCRIYACLDSAIYESDGMITNYNYNHKQKYDRTIRVQNTYQRATSVMNATSTATTGKVINSLKAGGGVIFGKIDMTYSLIRAVTNAHQNTASNAVSNTETFVEITKVSGTLGSRQVVRFYKPRVEIQTFAVCFRRSRVPALTFYEIGTTRSSEPSVSGVMGWVIERNVSSGNTSSISESLNR